MIFHDFCSFSLAWDPMGAKISKRYSSLKSLLNLFKTISGFYSQRFSQIYCFEIVNIWSFTILFRANIGPYGNQNFKTLLLQQITFVFFQSFPNFLLSSPDKSTVLDFWNLCLRFFPQFKVHHCTLWVNSKVRDRHVVTICINREPYMESQMTASHLTLSDLEGQSQGHSDYILTLVTLKGQSQGVFQVSLR